MAETIETARTILSVAASLLYVYVGVVTGRRTVPEESRLALRAWQTWWIGLGAVGLLGQLMRPWVESNTDVNLYLAYILPLLAVLVAIVAALVYYLLYLYTGSQRVLARTAAYFTALGLFFITLFLGAFSPAGYPAFEERDGDTQFVLGPEGGTTDTLTFVGGILLVLPLLAGAVAYALLFFRLEGRTERYRIGMVSGGFVLWFGSSMVGTLLGRVTDLPDWWSLFTQAIAFTAALMALAAYYPPKAWQTKHGLRSIKDEA